MQVRAYKSDGTCYRWWHSTVEAVETGRVILLSPVGQRVQDISGAWTSEHAIRTFYWLDRWYSLSEVYAPTGRLVEIFVNINSPPEVDGSQMGFTDYELDVTREPPHKARIVDQDEFVEAAAKYGYPEEFQQACYEVAREALEVADRWVARGMPAMTA